MGHAVAAKVSRGGLVLSGNLGRTVRGTVQPFPWVSIMGLLTHYDGPNYGKNAFMSTAKRVVGAGRVVYEIVYFLTPCDCLFEIIPSNSEPVPMGYELRVQGSRR